MSVLNRKDVNIINPPESGESFFYNLTSGGNITINVPDGKTVCYFVPTESTNVFYTYSKDDSNPAIPATATTSNGVINSHLLPNALNVSYITKIRLAAQAATSIYIEFRDRV